MNEQHEAPAAGVDPVARLEQLRQQIETVHHRACGKAESLELAPTDRAQRAQALRSIALDREREAKLEQELAEVVRALRRDAPHTIATWAEMHQGICARILGERGPSDLDERERAHRHELAQRTAREWDRVREGLADYVRVHRHLLADYAREASSWLAGALGRKR